MRRLPGLLVMAAVLWAASAGRADAQLSGLFSPGKLAKAHSSLEGISSCQKCHEQGQKVTANKCLACHAPVAARISRKVGVHKDVKGDCAVCHAEHGGVDGDLRPFDQARFDHAAVTGFALTGKHALGADKCAACHKTRSFLNASTTCVSCHADVHKGSLGANCVSCHSTERAFKELGGQFDHTKARFQLVGAHKTVACATCHVNKVFKGIKFASCTDCHRDPHVQKFGPACTTCHTNDTWRTKRVDHAKTAFPLVGSHTTVDCAACHKQPSMKVKPKADTCAACHVDVHKGTFKQDCKSCHNESSWGKAPFDHSQTKFQLTGKHDGLTCVKCHTTVSLAAKTPAGRVADFRGLNTTCVSCHTDVHQAALGVACESCHSSSTFKVTTFSHSKFPEFFGGQHASLTCVQCHLAPAPTARPVRTGVPIVANYKEATTTCVSCHKDVHLGQEGSACETCHTVQTARFAVAAFAHDTKTTFPLTGKHKDVTCAGCHKPETGAFPAGSGTAIRLKGVGRECRSCHQDVHLGQVNDRCETCHVTTTFKVPSYKHLNKSLSSFFVGSHVKATCVDCHKPATGKFPKGTGTAVRFKVDAKCVACHTDIHRGSLGPNCANCHKP